MGVMPDEPPVEESGTDWDKFIEVLVPIVLKVHIQIWQTMPRFIEWGIITPVDFEMLLQHCPKKLARIETKLVHGCSRCAQSRCEERRDALVGPNAQKKKLGRRVFIA